MAGAAKKIPTSIQTYVSYVILKKLSKLIWSIAAWLARVTAPHFGTPKTDRQKMSGLFRNRRTHFCIERDGHEPRSN